MLDNIKTDNTIESIINGLKADFTCPNCKHKQTINIFPYIDFSKNPEYYALTKDLSIFNIECESCKTNTLIKFDTLIFNDTYKYFIYFLSNKDAYNKFKNEITYFIETSLNKNHQYNLGDYKTRLVFDHNSLIEKMQIFENELNDKAIELIKYAIYNKGMVDETVYDTLVFDGIEKTNLIFIALNTKTSTFEPKRLEIDFRLYNQVIPNVKKLDKYSTEYFDIIDKDWVYKHLDN